DWNKIIKDKLARDPEHFQNNSPSMHNALSRATGEGKSHTNDQWTKFVLEAGGSQGAIADANSIETHLKRMGLSLADLGISRIVTGSP
ncbi:hypothetical protein ABI011_14850, partial [Enterococcus faecium]|uniref:hypothetical protein n=1 Tax=Enterococcus faecium TaxID=1352 RepID=UPI003F43182B